MDIATTARLPMADDPAFLQVFTENLFTSAWLNAGWLSKPATWSWYSVAMAFKWGATVADLEAQYHEWNPPGLLKYLPGTGGGGGSKMDLALSRQGIALGRALATNQTRPSQVGPWLRQTLGKECDKAATNAR